MSRKGATGLQDKAVSLKQASSQTIQDIDAPLVNSIDALIYLYLYSTLEICQAIAPIAAETCFIKMSTKQRSGEVR